MPSIRISKLGISKTGFSPSIKAQIDEFERNLDIWNQVFKKAIDIKASTIRQPLSGILEIDALYFQRVKLAKAKNKSVYNKNSANSFHGFFTNLESQSGHFFSDQISALLFL